MKQFQLSRVKHGGKTYRGCVLSVDEAAGQAEVAHVPRGLLRKSVSLTKFGIDAKIRVVSSEGSLNLGGLEMVPSSPGDASAILSILDAPRRVAMERAEAALAFAERQALGFLGERGETLTFLDRIRRDAADALLELYVAKRKPADVAMKEYLESRAEALAAALTRLDSALADLADKASPQVAERVYAVTYLAGTMQTNLFERGRPGLEMEAFLTEVGISVEDLSPPFDELAGRLIAASHRVTAALLG